MTTVESIQVAKISAVVWHGTYSQDVLPESRESYPTVRPTMKLRVPSSISRLPRKVSRDNECLVRAWW